MKHPHCIIYSTSNDFEGIITHLSNKNAYFFAETQHS